MSWSSSTLSEIKNLNKQIDNAAKRDRHHGQGVPAVVRFQLALSCLDAPTIYHEAPHSQVNRQGDAFSAATLCSSCD